MSTVRVSPGLLRRAARLLFREARHLREAYRQPDTKQWESRSAERDCTDYTKTARALMRSANSHLRTLALVALLAPLSALEIAGIDWRNESDKQTHAGAGAAVAAVTLLQIERHAPQWPWWVRGGVAIAVPCVLGAVWEVIEEPIGIDSEPDHRDWIATTAGAFPIVLTLTWRF